MSTVLPTLPISPVQSVLPEQVNPSKFFKGLQVFALCIGVIILFYLLVNNLGKNGEHTSAELPIDTISRSQAVVVSDTDQNKVDVNTNGKRMDSTLIEDIQFATKGDGSVREVDVNGKSIDSALVKLAAFENRDFVLRDESTLKQRQGSFVPFTVPQRSHFRAMTYPLVNNDRDRLGNDVFRGGVTDLRVNISETEGRA